MAIPILRRNKRVLAPWPLLFAGQLGIVLLDSDRGETLVDDLRNRRSHDQQRSGSPEEQMCPSPT